MRTRILFDLQDTDLRLGELQQELDAVQQAMHAPALLQEMEERLHALIDRAEDLARKQRSLEFDVQNLSTQAKQLEERLYGGLIRSAREAESAQQKVAELRRRQRALEDQVLELMMTLEGLDEERRDLEASLQRARLEWGETRKTLEARSQALATEQARLQRVRAELVDRLAPEVVQAYERLRRSKAGIAVARLEARVCQACGVDVPVSVERQVRYDEVLVFCPTCGRMLVM